MITNNNINQRNTSNKNANINQNNEPTTREWIKKYLKEWWNGIAIFLLSVSAVILIALLIILGYYYFDANESIPLLSSTTTLVTKVTGRLENQTDCGVPSVINGLRFPKKSINTGRIMNGRDAPYNSWPWVISLRTYRKGRVGTHFCAGSLIYSRYVLTAAHCVERYDIKNMVVIAGCNSLGEKPQTSNIYKVTGLILNPEYDRENIINDIAVIKLDRDVELSSKISTVCLPSLTENSFDVIDKDVVLTGWGSINGKDTKTVLASNLQQAILKISDPTISNICYSSNTFDQSKVYCAFNSDGDHESNACFGDSGGPLIYFKDNKWHIYGIVSYILTDNSVKSCDPSLPSYHTQVAKYLQFIGNAIANLKIS